MTRKILRALPIIVAMSFSSPLLSQEYRRATDDPDNVKDKIFTKKGRVELNLPDVGFVMNQAFITTYLLHGGITYYKDEEWGYGIEASYGLNDDKYERKCLETFYNDPLNRVEQECGTDGGEDKLDNQASNYGPAYMPIREIKYIVAANVVWNPVYGKQIFFTSGTSYFDIFLTAGGGVVISDYYEQLNELKNGQKARAKFKDGQGLEGGASTNESYAYGEAGRPDAQQQTHPFINLGLGQKYHFWKRMSFKVEFRNMTLLGTPDGFENLFAIWGGMGFRF